MPRITKKGGAGMIGGVRSPLATSGHGLVGSKTSMRSRSSASSGGGATGGAFSKPAFGGMASGVAGPRRWLARPYRPQPDNHPSRLAPPPAYQETPAAHRARTVDLLGW